MLLGLTLLCLQTPQGNRYIDNFLNTVMGDRMSASNQAEAVSERAASSGTNVAEAVKEAAEELVQQPRMAIS